ncbi:MAG TPA: LacI family DNA-binding transcriptional regulator [Sphingobacteriaceae bacterium]|nr:LacI family DNA-binding transcriptional regulator [Sphingobacteriaceae bacterium]
MKVERITMKDIAKALGLSISTVSKALRDSYEISQTTKKLIVDYVQEQNYVPNPIARSLKDGKSKSIGVVLCSIDNTFYSQVLNGIDSVAYSKGYNIIINQNHESYERELLNIKHLISTSIDGLLVSVSTETKDYTHLIELQKKGLPIVLFDRLVEEINTHKIKIDNLQASYEGTVHLIKAGFKTIAHITSSPNLSISTERLAGFKKALTENNLPVNDEYIKFCDHGGMVADEVDSAITQLLNLAQPPDAIFTASDRITTRTLSFLNIAGIKIPEDIALMGFTNTALAEVLNPPLTSITQPAFEMGQLAAQKLIELVESKYPVEEFETLVLNTELHIRKSTSKGKIFT